MNPYESGTRKIIPAVLVYLTRHTKERLHKEVLMLFRNKKKNDVHAQKWNGLGGKMELNETPVQTAAREIEEESGIKVPENQFKPLGIIHFPNFKKDQDWLVYILKAHIVGETKDFISEEGELSWVLENHLLDLELWDGDKIFLPYVINEKPFIGTFYYVDGKLTTHWIHTL